ncbi:MAG: methionyl-tRNA formyltransferase [Clostridiales bacterium]|nr:methionyl-tRNA formyltransferase [Clostridiales bacterium]
MNIVYMGTPDFAVPALRRIHEEGHNIKLVVTQPDRPRDRGKKLRPTPVKVIAEELGIPVCQPDRIKNNDEFLDKLKEIAPDLIVVVAYGKILPKEILDIPKYGCINIHASILPKYRGPAPIQHAILSGDSETGVTLMYMAEGMDTGDMIDTRTTLIDKKTAGELHDELAILGAEMLIDNLTDLKSGEAKRIKQDESLATYAPMIYKKDGLIDFNKSPVEIERQIRAMTPWPGAYTFYKGEQMKVISAHPHESDEKEDKQPGTISYVGPEGIGIVTKDGLLLVTEIQMPGKRAMKVSEFLKGNKIEIGTVLG